MRSIAIGREAALQGQGNYTVAIGGAAQGGAISSQSSVAIGYGAGHAGQGANSIAIGRDAGYTSQPANSIILNATGSQYNGASGNAFYVKPIRDNASASGHKLV